MSLRFQRRLASSILKCGENRVRFDTERLEDIEDAITRDDIRRLIIEGAIYAVHERGQTRSRVKEKRGMGRRKGGRYSKLTRKERWIQRVRAQRRLLRHLRDSGSLDPSEYRSLYLQVKAGRFKSLADLKLLLREKGVLSKGSMSR
ncbi:MAG: 50S ribosomal protein L19e [Aigarchaeota archaeon]|nr:50S ribosomal protein L19e [Aigarchaeota archaeon]MDW8092555.1 50S ribosomal protein L19e [Nitrososphaerota archaeon]